MAETNRAGSRPGDDLQAAVNQVEDDDRRDWERPRDPAPGAVAARQSAPPPPSDQDVETADESPIVRIAHTIIQQAVNDHASEIQVEPRAEDVTILFRINGVLHEALKLPKAVQRKLVTRYKYMADMEVDEQSRPQEGRIAISHAGMDYDLSVHSEPAPGGERIVIAVSEKP